VKLLAIRIADWIDSKVVRHRLYGKRGGLCYLISTSPWWGPRNPTPASSREVWRRSRR